MFLRIAHQRAHVVDVSGSSRGDQPLIDVDLVDAESPCRLTRFEEAKSRGVWIPEPMDADVYGEVRHG